MNFSQLSAVDLVLGYARLDFSPTEVMRCALQRAHTFEPRLNAFTLLDDDTAMAMAAASEARWLCGAPMGLLDGVPVAVKDTANVRGWPTRYGSLSGQSAQAATDDAPLVMRLREHGAAFIGKTATPEFAWKGVTDSAAHGVTRNPWDTSRTPGGSSGGSAAAVAVGVVPMATGADGGGSLRIPAAFTGIFGLKPTAGLIPNLPSPLGTLAVVGSLTRSVADAALFLRVVVAPDVRDSFAAPLGDTNFVATLHEPVAGLRIGVSHDLGFGAVDPDVAQALADTVRHLRSQGAVVEDVDLRADDTRDAFETLWALGFSEILGRLSVDNIVAIEPALQRVIAVADRVTGHQAQSAARMARVFSARMATFFERYDLLLTPTTPISAFEAGRLTPDNTRYPHWWDWTPLTWPFNLSRNPAASCPAGLNSAGLPIGMQLVGRWFDERTVLRVAHALESFNHYPVALAASDTPQGTSDGVAS